MRPQPDVALAGGRARSGHVVALADGHIVVVYANGRSVMARVRALTAGWRPA